MPCGHNVPCTGRLEIRTRGMRRFTWPCRPKSSHPSINVHCFFQPGEQTEQLKMFLLFWYCHNVSPSLSCCCPCSLFLCFWFLSGLFPLFFVSFSYQYSCYSGDCGCGCWCGGCCWCWRCWRCWWCWWWFFVVVVGGGGGGRGGVGVFLGVGGWGWVLVRV